MKGKLGVAVHAILLSSYFACIVLSVTINSVQIKDSAVPTKGSNIQLVCSISGFTSDTAGRWYKTDTQTVPDGTRAQVQCIQNTCIDTLPGYTYSADASNMYVTITDLSQSTDGKWWTCRFNKQSKALPLVVYTVPQSLLYERVPSVAQDLSTNNVSLKCKSSCAYPAPNFVWYYTETGGSRQQYSTSAVAGEETGSTCTDTEKLYTSTLALPRYTTFTGNADKTVKLECGIPIFPGRDTALYTPLSQDITFAVKTTSVTLKDDSSEPTSSSVITVTSGSPMTLTCSPSLSRPAATLVWYIGNVEKQRSSSTSFTFTPSDNDHDKQVYCKAFNIPPVSQSVFSQRPKLYVQVQVSSVTLAHTLNKIVVTSGVEETLTCTPGTNRPSATIIWYKGTTKQSTTGTSFSFTPTNDDHDKTVYCKAYNIQPEEQAVSSATPRLYVRVLATTPTLLNKTSPGNLILLSGDEVKLVCTSSATRPAATVTWKKGTTLLGSGEVTQSPETANLVSVTSVLTITPVNDDNNQVIKCETSVSDQANTQSVQETIDVWWSPSTISIEPSLQLPWRDDQTGNFLKCKSNDYGNPIATTNWTSQYGATDEATSRLSFPQLSHVYDTKAVTCELSNGYTQRKGIHVISPTLNLDVEYKPIVTIKKNDVMMDSVTVNEGQSLSVSCTAVGNPDPSVRWTSNPTGGGLLQFTDIDRQYDKPYTCLASAKSTRYPSYSFVTQKTLDVTVNFAPEVSADLSTSSLKENSSVNIICKAAGRPATYTYTDLVQTWRDTVIPNTHSNLVGTEQHSSLALTSLQLQDTGNYTCHVNNGIIDRTGKLNQTGNVYLKVKVSPKILPVQVNFAGAPGDTVNISIPFYSYPAVVGVTFAKQGGGPIQNDDRHTVSYPPTPVLTKFYGQDVTLEGNTAILQITNLQVEDFANYTLAISNSMGNKLQLCSLASQSKPLPPKPFVYLGLFDGVPQFYWEQGFNGGHNQFFVIETTITGTDNWIKHVVVEEGDQLYQQVNKSYIANITGLAPGQYSARLTAENKLGPIGVSDRPTVTFTIPEIPSPPPSSDNLAAIGGGTGAAVLVIIIVAVILFVWKRRRSNKDGSRTDLELNNERHINEGVDNDSDDEVITENATYDSAGPRPQDNPTAGPSNQDNTYAIVNKHNKPLIEPNNTDVYAEVKKPQKKNNVPDIYALPVKKKEDKAQVKPKPKEKEKKKPKDDKNKKKDGGKQKKGGGDVYENAPASAIGGAYDENPYENPEDSIPNKPKKNVNKDGLIYADLSFKPDPKGQGKLVIHGLDDMTEYVQVDFTKKAEPLPDSDEEDQNANTKK